jgi:hypothetical protein
VFSLQFGISWLSPLAFNFGATPVVSESIQKRANCDASIVSARGTFKMVIDAQPPAVWFKHGNPIFRTVEADGRRGCPSRAVFV